MNPDRKLSATIMRRAARAAFALALLLQAATARAETKADSGTAMVEITLTADKRFLVHGEETTLGKLPARLKAAGATKSTAIFVAVDKSTPAVTMKAIAGKLKSEGYTRVVFTRPRHAEASVSSNAPSLPAPPTLR